jgi:hypothetical protein
VGTSAEKQTTAMTSALRASFIINPRWKPGPVTQVRRWREDVQHFDLPTASAARAINMLVSADEV